MTDATITPTDNGAYMVEGPLRVVDADGTEYELSQQTTILLCRCGHSSTKALVDVFAAVGASEKAAAVVEPGKGALDDPPLAAEPGAMLSLTARDDRLDAPLPDEPSVLVVVVTAVGDQHPRSTSRAADTATDR